MGHFEASGGRPHTPPRGRFQDAPRDTPKTPPARTPTCQGRPQGGSQGRSQHMYGHQHVPLWASMVKCVVLSACLDQVYHPCIVSLRGIVSLLAMLASQSSDDLHGILSQPDTKAKAAAAAKVIADQKEAEECVRMRNVRQVYPFLHPEDIKSDCCVCETISDV